MRLLIELIHAASVAIKFTYYTARFAIKFTYYTASSNSYQECAAKASYSH